MTSLTIEKAEKGYNFAFDDCNPNASEGIDDIYEPSESNFQVAKGKGKKFYIFYLGREDWLVDYYKSYFKDYLKDKERIDVDEFKDVVIRNLMNIAADVYCLSNDHSNMLSIIILDGDDLYLLNSYMYLKKVAMPYYADMFSRSVIEGLGDIPFEDKLMWYQDCPTVRNRYYPFVIGNTESKKVTVLGMKQAKRKVSLGEFRWE